MTKLAQELRSISNVVDGLRKKDQEFELHMIDLAEAIENLPDGNASALVRRIFSDMEKAYYLPEELGDDSPALKAATMPAASSPDRAIPETPPAERT